MLNKEDVKVIKELLSDQLTEQKTGIMAEVKCMLAKQKDSIVEEVKDLVDFRVEKAEVSIKAELVAEIGELKDDISTMKVDIADIKRNIDDMIETDQAFLEKFGNHETRICRVENKVGLEAA